MVDERARCVAQVCEQRNFPNHDFVEPQDFSTQCLLKFCSWVNFLLSPFAKLRADTRILHPGISLSTQSDKR